MVENGRNDSSDTEVETREREPAAGGRRESDILGVPGEEAGAATVVLKTKARGGRGNSVPSSDPGSGHDHVDLASFLEQ